ncbi:MAG: HD domain-containing protein [Deltaproteobacteria bacterium]|nr:HD domain-containing protein [Deltaproteobacteria bacterium]
MRTKMSSKKIVKPLVVRDEIHGDIGFDSLLRQVIDHPYFQRLRYIKQLGLAEYVFPCATHTRFQHSLGASFLAGQYFETMVKAWVTSSFEFEGKVQSTQLFAKKTKRVVEQVAQSVDSKQFWWQTVSLAGLLHDVGHGPWSHTFEYLDLNQDFSDVTSQIGGAVGAYFKELKEEGRKLHHEDISVLYIFSIFKELKVENVYFLPVALLVNHKMAVGRLKSLMEKELALTLKKNGIEGGIETHQLLRPIISGPFDVDRIDYIQRDGRNCGVHIGGIEWRRIVTKLVPCLAEHHGSKREPKEVVLISNIKNQHVIDDFIFSLFQMYAQVYMHPKIVGVEEIAKRLLKKRVDVKSKPTVNFKLHSSLSDEKFRTMLVENFGVPEIESILLRRPGYHFSVASLPPEENIMNRELKKHGYSLINTLDRPMMKDSLGVFLFSSFRNSESGKGEFFLEPWTQVSPIAKQFFMINYSPKLWIQSSVV